MSINSLVKERIMKTLPITKMQQIKTTAMVAKAVVLPGVTIAHYCLPSAF
jgi:hypothetical protein